ncbi:hypothetical protein BLNAU_4001 [Blattamonas nauphoetae]|uniref:Uncharacterized protein n=1 Tax=Blattamonas nauphoetae TaxID=2049346 RepID=A0ABQ9YB23_9EUKA|nr:hypothetical protein BLNAU_4001 [Blattamonas nauphoetae]
MNTIIRITDADPHPRRPALSSRQLASSVDCSPFLNWQYNRKAPDSENRKAVVFQSLVATVKSKPAFDASLVAKAVNFLKSVNRDDDESSDAFLSHFGQTNDDSLTEFVQSIMVLISSPSQIITTTAMEMLTRLIADSSAKVRLSLAKADLIPQLILTLNPQSLSFTEAEDIHTSLMTAIINTFWYSTPNGLRQLGIQAVKEPKAVYETVLKQVLSPSEKYIWHLCVNRFSIVVGEQSRYFMFLLAHLIQICPNHQPTMDFVLNMPIFVTIPSCLTFFENDESIYLFLHLRVQLQWRWNIKRGNQRQMWKTVLRILRKEGFEDAIDERLQNDRNGTCFGRWIVDYSIGWNNMQGLNLPKYE